MAPKDERTGRKEADGRLVAELASGKSIADVAAAVGVGQRTIYRRLQSPKFRSRLDAAKDALVSQAVTLAANNLSKASDTLVKLLDSKSEMVQLNAARALHDITHRQISIENLDRRVREMKRLLRERKK